MAVARRRRRRASAARVLAAGLVQIAFAGELQAERLSAPVYTVIRTEGQPHDRTFFVEAAWGNGRAEGTGTSIKSAEMMAASEALKLLQNDGAAAAKRKG